MVLTLQLKDENQMIGLKDKYKIIHCLPVKHHTGKDTDQVGTMEANLPKQVEVQTQLAQAS